MIGWGGVTSRLGASILPPSALAIEGTAERRLSASGQYKPGMWRRRWRRRWRQRRLMVLVWQWSSDLTRRNPTFPADTGLYTFLPRPIWPFERVMWPVRTNQTDPCIMSEIETKPPSLHGPLQKPHFCSYHCMHINCSLQRWTLDKPNDYCLHY